MIPFYTRFPELAVRETRCAHITTPGGPLPLGEYGFVELYCDEPDCDCRRVVLLVTTPQAPDTSLATINYGWESVEFYTQKMYGDKKAGRDITSATLDPLNPQSRYANHLLAIFRDIVRNDPAYVARLARHYEMFKRDLGESPQSSTSEEGIPLEESDQFQSAPPPFPARQQPSIAREKPGRNDSCPYGSGKKFKKCCGKN